MKVSYNWIKEFIQIDNYTPEQIAGILQSIGFEIEEISVPFNIPDLVISTKIEEISKHPNADKLVLCRVIDDQKVYSIVCGAKNIKAGDVVPLALPGSVMPNGLEIKLSSIRGENSDGMLCSSKELNINQDHAGIMILPPDTPLGKSLNSLYDLKDVVFDIAVSPNRPDCLSVMGIARELSAKLAINLRTPELYVPRKTMDDHIPVEIQNDELCSRYIASYISNVSVKESPNRIKFRLISHGLRPINNIVDITNYVLLEIGHPLHAFDIEKMSDSKIVVRKANQDEKVTALNGIEYKLKSDMLVIADSKSAQAIAGVIGAEKSGVTEITKNIILESALFNSSSIRSTRNALNVSTDASYRFERGCSWDNSEMAYKRAIYLILEVAQGNFVSSHDVYSKENKNKKMFLRTSQVNKVLGTSYEKKDIVDILQRLQMRIEPQDDNLSVEVPSFRIDVNEEIDLIEDVARIKGYDTVPATLRISSLQENLEIEPVIEVQRKVQMFMSGQGIYEALNYSFYKNDLSAIISEDNMLIEIDNPLSKDTQYLRPSLLPSLLSNLNHNLNNQITDIKLYEFGKTYNFRKTSNKVSEEYSLALILKGNIESTQWNVKVKPIDFYYVSGLVQELLAKVFNLTDFREITNENTESYYDKTVSAVIHAKNGEAIASFGLLDSNYLKDIEQNIYYAEINLEQLLKAKSQNKEFVQFSTMPTSKRDLSVLAPEELNYSLIAEEISKLNSNDISVSSRLFDIYKGDKIHKDMKSLSFTLYFNHKSKTMTDDEINNKVTHLLDRLGKHGITLRTT
ncbi:MAG: phenylalanine--tRNA ligase subunit beta [Elusimicrobia bacterium RIFOXYA2_FULL_39_19]|nr:MAG: phenylalanine--tRNA ligase subunit beta [Elusimicrobia bacterium RIFOXYA2_FULL_39_19]